MSVMEEQEIYALDLDEDLINHLAIPESVDRLRAEGVDERLIVDEDTIAVFNWQMAHLRQHRACATPEVLEDEFEDIEIATPFTAIDDWIGRARSRYLRTHGEDWLDDLISTYKDDPANLVDDLAKASKDLQKVVAPRGDVYVVEDFDRYLVKYDDQVLAGRGPSLGFDDVDEHFHGMRGITFFLAPPKGGKTWYTVNSAIENVLTERNVVIFSLEIPAFEMDARIRHMAAEVPWWKYLKGALSPAERQLLGEASNAMLELGSYTVIHPGHGERNVDQMMERALELEPDVVYFDQLQYFENEKKQSIGTVNDTGAYWDACMKLRDYSDEVPVWLVHQFNRSVMFADELPSMQQAKGSAAIEETATLTLGAWANKDMRLSNVIQVGTLNSRNYEWVSWDFNANFRKGCSIEMIGKVE